MAVIKKPVYLFSGNVPLGYVVSTTSLQQNISDLSSAANSYEVNPRNA